MWFEHRKERFFLPVLMLVGEMTKRKYFTQKENIKIELSLGIGGTLPSTREAEAGESLGSRPTWSTE